MIDVNKKQVGGKHYILLYGVSALVFLVFLYYITRPGAFSGN